MEELYTLDQFKVKNYRSFRDEQELNFFSNRPITALYGANASGKSNFFHALTVFCRFIRHSINPDMPGTPYTPFLLCKGNNKLPSEFSATFHNSAEKYRYSFSVLADRVVEEEMIDLSTSRPRLIFRRSEGSSETFTRNGFSKKLFEGPESVRDDSLLITLARRTKNHYANAVFNLIQNLDTFVLTNVEHMVEHATDILQQKPELERQVIEYLHKADFSITDFSYNISKYTPEMLANIPISEEVKDRLLHTVKNVSINTTHSVRDSNGDKVDTIAFDMSRQESLGTRIFFNLIIFVLDAIQSGKTLYIDEFGASLHTKLCSFIIQLFKSKNNRSGAKLIINTHDVGLLKNGLSGVLDKEDVFIVEKDRFEQTQIKPLSVLVKRSDENIGKKYTIGFYGGVPIIEEID